MLPSGPVIEFPGHPRNNTRDITAAVLAIAALAEVRPALAEYRGRGYASIPADAQLRGAHSGAEVPPAVPQTSPRSCTICIDLPRSGGREEPGEELAQA